MKKKIFVKSPAGKNKLKFKNKKAGKILCLNCRIELSGLPRIKSSKLGKTTRNLKKINRKYGGLLCSGCSREEIVRSVEKWK
jgi:large subunit ribosomal protein L34e